MINKRVLFEDEEVDAKNETDIISSSALISSSRGRLIIMATRYLKMQQFSISGIYRIVRVKGVTLRPSLSNPSLAKDASTAKKVATAVNEIINEVYRTEGITNQDDNTNYLLSILVTKFLTDFIG